MADPCPTHKVPVGLWVELTLNCQHSGTGHGGNCRMELVPGVVIMWSKNLPEQP